LKIDVFQNRIFIFTPKGDVIDLPENSTPIDFAYNLHTDLGDKCMGAKVNDKMARLDTKLLNGDVVEIIIDKNRKAPSEDWLRFIKTNTAKNKIKNKLQKIKKG
jgi:GTP pyrophosphokinase